MSGQGVWGLGFSPAAASVLSQLHAAGVIQGHLEGSADLRKHWHQARAFVVVGACGLVVRQIAPLLQGKDQDPAVVVVDPQGAFAIPLLGAHQAGGDTLSQRVAAISNPLPTMVLLRSMPARSPRVRSTELRALHRRQWALAANEALRRDSRLAWSRVSKASPVRLAPRQGVQLARPRAVRVPARAEALLGFAKSRPTSR